ncbi:MEDS domain-containing protein [Saccharomonospora xinjiangensis]|uniref:STAS domain-containing protein n=1 Tax=Saccharomonospora xinjiangensis XJ-54 TaxID=882086 RepID=I0V7G7_9PSEU|nr:MEDS domain-containing protein [Saccharomonospora xinjiangensis]EID56070.1 hypothetical protein SacxiDRAFT_3879 [Saccharomonospora xinjiangensis XJ-54]
MRWTSTLATPGWVGQGWHDHACWFHTGRQSWCDVLVPFFTEAILRGEAMLYVSDKSVEELTEDLETLPGRDALLLTGQLRFLPVEPVRGMTGGQAVADQLGTLRSAAADAVEAGYARVRIAADSAHPVQGRADAVRFVHSELLIDEVVARTPVALLCGYDGRYLDRRAAAALAFVHPVRQHAAFGAGSGLYAEPDATDFWHVYGELDLASRDVFEIALDALPVHGDVHMKLHELAFIDVGGVHALADFAERISPRRLVLHDPPTALRRIVELSRADFPAMRRVVAEV